MKTLEIRFLGKDKHNRDVYQTSGGTILKNIKLDGKPTQENMCTSLNNSFEGEADTPLIYNKQRYCFVIVNNF